MICETCGEDITGYIHSTLDGVTCTAFKKQRPARTPEEIQAKLAAIQAAEPIEDDYIAGIFDGACAVLGWVLGKTETCELGGKEL